MMENLQAACLVIGTCSLWLQASNVTGPALKHALIFAGLGYFNMFLLEFDVRPFDNPLLTRVLSGFVRDASLGALWLYFLIRARHEWRGILKQVLIWMRSAVGVVLGTAAAFWIAGAVLEEMQVFSRQMNAFPEELMETNAALLMLWAALEVKRQRSHSSLQPERISAQPCP